MARGENQPEQPSFVVVVAIRSPADGLLWSKIYLAVFGKAFFNSERADFEKDRD